MRPTYFTILLTSLIVLTVFFSCVKEDNCTNAICLHQGTCVQGVCQCPAGYSGENCQYINRNYSIGKYKGEGQCHYVNNGYKVTVTEGPDPTSLSIKNLLELPISVIAKYGSRGDYYDTFLLVNQPFGSDSIINGTAAFRTTYRKSSEVEIHFTINEISIPSHKTSCEFEGDVIE